MVQAMRAVGAAVGGEVASTPEGEGAESRAEEEGRRRKARVEARDQVSAGSYTCKPCREVGLGQQRYISKAGNVASQYPRRE